MYCRPVEGVIPALSDNNNSLTTQLLLWSCRVLSHNMYQQMEKADKYISAVPHIVSPVCTIKVKFLLVTSCFIL